jgi:hypothetical protein
VSTARGAIGHILLADTVLGQYKTW